MAERSTAKQKRGEGSKGTSKGASETWISAENARLTVELATARARIAELEQKQADIINRIDWVIDSLHNLVE